MTLTDFMCQEKKEGKDSAGFKMALKYRLETDTNNKNIQPGMEFAMLIMKSGKKQITEELELPN